MRIRAGSGDLIQIGDGSSAQNSLALVPHHIVLNHVYVHGDRYVGQKRGIALNAASVTISDSYIAECKGIGQDTQAIGGWNGPGPYTIENNYLEAAGENVMFGGAGSRDSRTWSPTASRCAGTTSRARCPGGNPILDAAEGSRRRP